MKVGIYDRWLPALGGGERMALALAECLTPDHEVDVIAHHPVDLDLAAAKLNVDTHRLRLRCLPEMSTAVLSTLTAEYDLFICASQTSFIPSQARHSLMLVFFPAPLVYSRPARLRRRIGLWLKRKLLVPEYMRGFYGIEQSIDRGLRWTDGCGVLQIPLTVRRARLRGWIGAQNSTAPTTTTLKLNGRVIARLDIPALDREVPFQIDLQAGQDAIATVEFVSEAQPQPIGQRATRSVGVAVRDLTIEHWRYRLYQGLFERRFKAWGLRLLHIPEETNHHALATYSVILAISRFTRAWIARYWSRDSELVYPPVDVEVFPPREKLNMILTVGRIFAGGHNKKHLPMIETFKRLVNDGLRNWEFHLAGSVDAEAVDQDYYRAVLRAAEGYPIFIHANAPLEQLRALYGAAKIYWHASGYGEDEQRDPIKFEHFGITTVEAMSAGAVPIVIGKAGQLEVVEHDRSGLQWRTLAELAAYTQRVIDDEVLWARLCMGAQQRSLVFSHETFKRRVHELVSELR